MNIHNAPGWATSHAYKAGDRVNAGPGYSATGTPGGGTYTSGSALYAWQATVAGTSAASGAGPAVSGSCAASTAVTDGSVRWKCLSLTDYVTVFGYYADQPPWAPHTTYSLWQGIRNGPQIYVNDLRATCSKTTPSGCDCVSASGGPGPVGSSFPVADGTCLWTSAGTDGTLPSNTPGYSSERFVDGVSVAIPVKAFTSTSCTPANGCASAQLMQGRYEGYIWNDREYTEANGESFPWTLNHRQGCPCGEDPTYNFSYNNIIILTAAPGESFRDNPNVRTNALSYNQANGVAIHVTTNAMDLTDQFITLVSRLQMKSDLGVTLNQPGGSIDSSILEGGAGTLAVRIDSDNSITNSVVITHGPIGIYSDYNGKIVNTTVIGAPGTSPKPVVGVYFNYMGAEASCPNLVNVAIFGFQYPAAMDAVAKRCFGSTFNGGNVTDASNTDSTSRFTVASCGAVSGAGLVCPRNMLAVTVDGATGNVPFSSSSGAKFYDTSRDFRTQSGSALIDAGVQPTTNWGYGYATYYWWYPPQPWAAADISGLARPQGGNYDAGAWEFLATGAGAGGKPNLRRPGQRP